MLTKTKVAGQAYTEYIVLLAGILAIAGIIYGVVQAIGNVYQQKQGDIEALGSW